MARMVSLRQAAAELSAGGDKVERSTLSRYVAAHADALRPRRDGKQLLVDLDVLAEFRRRHLGKPHHDAPAPAPEAAPTPGAVRSREVPASGLSLAEERKAKLHVDRRLRSLSLADRVKQLTLAAEADAAAREAVKLMRAALDGAAAAATVEIARDVLVPAERVRPDLQAYVDTAHAAFRDELSAAGLDVEGGGETAGVTEGEVPPVDADAEDPATLADARAAKLRVDRLHRDLTLGIRTGALASCSMLENAAHAAVAGARQALASGAAETAERLAAALMVEARLLRGIVRRMEHAAISAFHAAVSAG